MEGAGLKNCHDSKMDFFDESMRLCRQIYGTTVYYEKRND